MVLPGFVQQLLQLVMTTQIPVLYPEERLFTGTLLSPTILNMREGHIGGYSSKHHKPMTCKRKE